MKECVESSSAELVIVYGRRRVGKTYLINNYFDNNFAFKITGRYNCSKEELLEVFAGEYMRKTKQKEKLVIERWMDAFNLLRDYLESLDSSKRQVVSLTKCRGLTRRNPISFRFSSGSGTTGLPPVTT